MIYSVFYSVIVTLLITSYDPRFKSIANLFYLYLFIAIILLVSLNYEVGQDYVGYQQIFLSVPIISFNESFAELILKYNQIHGEYAFLFVNSILKTIGLCFNSVYFFNSFLSLSIIAVLCWKKLTKPLYGLFLYFSLYFLTLQFVQIRIGLVTSLYLLFFVLVVSKRFFLSFLTLVLGIFFHKMLAIGFCFYFFMWRSYLWVILILFIASWLLFFINPLDYLHLLIGFDFWAIEQLRHYSAKDKYLNQSFPVLGYSYRLGLLLLMIYIYKFSMLKNRLIELGLISLSLSLFCLVSLWEFSFLAVRFSKILSIVIIILVPIICTKSNSIKLRLLLFFYTLSFCVYTFFSLVLDEHYQFVPYKHILGF